MMKRFATLMFAAAVGAGLPAIAIAQDAGRGRDRGEQGDRRDQDGPRQRDPRGSGGGQDVRPATPPQPQALPQPAQPPQAQAAPPRQDFGRRGFEPGRDRGEGARFGRPGFADGRDPGPNRADRDDGRPGPDRRYGGPDRRYDDPRARWNDARPAPRPDGRFAGDWRQDRRYDWRSYRTTNRAAFRVGRYVAPRGYGYGYRRFSVGVTVPSLLWSQTYWLDDPYAYRLPPAYGPYRWVRYYDDVLLIDLRSGRVVEMIPDFFW